VHRSGPGPVLQSLTRGRFQTAPEPSHHALLGQLPPWFTAMLSVSGRPWLPCHPACIEPPHAMRCQPYPLTAWLHRNEGLLCFLFARLCSLHVCFVTPHPSHQLSGILSPLWASPGPRAAPRLEHHPPLDHLHKVPPLVLHQPPRASTWTAHSSHPSAPPPPPRAPQPLRGPHRHPRPVVHLYHHRYPRLTHAAVDGLTGEYSSSPLPQMGSPSRCVALAVTPEPPHRQGSPETDRCHRPWPWSCLPCLYSTMGHQPMGGRQLSWAGRIGPRVNSSLYSFLIYSFESIWNLVQT
jgi:hypothetical protein